MCVGWVEGVGEGYENMVGGGWVGMVGLCGGIREGIGEFEGGSGWWDYSG